MIFSNKLLIFGFALILLTGAVVAYDTKYSARNSGQQVKSLEKKIQEEKVAITLLNAEWSLLSQPNRIQRLVSSLPDNLMLRTISPTQIKQIEVLNLILPVQDISSSMETKSDAELLVEEIEKQNLHYETLSQE